jgi:hypothetical protein
VSFPHGFYFVSFDAFPFFFVDVLQN